MNNVEEHELQKYEIRRLRAEFESDAMVRFFLWIDGGVRALAYLLRTVLISIPPARASPHNILVRRRSCHSGRVSGP